MSEMDQSVGNASFEQDLIELSEGRPLSRHAWLQEILDDPNIQPNTYGQNPPRDVCLTAMLTRIKDLASLPERDMELERATVELGKRFTSGPLYDGGSAVFEWVRATEVYEDLRTDGEIFRKDQPQIVRSDIVGIGNIYADYKTGNEIEGISEEQRDRWFMSFGASGILVHIPFNAITEVVDSSKMFHEARDGSTNRYGSVIESPTDRSEMFLGWIQREAA